MKSLTFGGILGFFIIALAFGCGGKANQNTGKLMFSVGEVTIKEANGWVPAQEQMTLKKGNEIKTGAQSQCNIVIGTDSFISVKENSHLIIDNLFKDVTGVEENSIELKVGKTIVNPKKLLKGDSFKIKTPTAVAAVRGTQFIIQNDPNNQLKIAVVTGKVELQRRIPALEDVDQDLMNKSESLTNLKEKVASEKLIVDANQSAFIDNQKAEQENKIIEKAIIEHVAEIKQDEQKKLEETENISLNEVEKNAIIEKNEAVLLKTLSTLAIVQKPRDSAVAIQVQERIAADDIKEVKELENVIIEVKAKEIEKRKEQTKDGAAVKPPVVTELAITSPVKNSKIYVNGRFFGDDAALLNPSPNETLKIEVAAAGYERFYKEVKLNEGEKISVQDTLIESSQLTIISPVQNAQVFVNSKFVGMGKVTVQPGSGIKLAIEVRANGFKSYTTELELNAGAREELNVTMERAVASKRANWNQKVGSTIMSNPVFYQDYIITTTSDGFLVSMNRAGKMLWRVDLQRRIESTPVVHNGKVFVVSNSGDFYAVGITDGQIHWKKKLIGSLLFGAQPVIGDNKIYLATSLGRVYAFAGDGKELWQTDIETGIYSSPAYKSGTLYIGAEDRNIYAISTKKGSIDWDFRTDSRMVSSTPLVENNTVYVGCYSGSVFAVSAGSGRLVWKFKTDDSILASPVKAGGNIIVGSSDGRIYAIAAGSGKQVWRFETGSRVVTSPSIARSGGILIGGGTMLYSLDPATGAVLWNHNFGGRIKTSAACIGNDIFVGLDNGEIASIKDSLFEAAE